MGETFLFLLYVLFNKKCSGHNKLLGTQKKFVGIDPEMLRLGYGLDG